jgi:hypothetical protein
MRQIRLSAQQVVKTFVFIAAIGLLGSGSEAATPCKVNSVSSATISQAPAMATLSTAHSGVPATLTVNFPATNGNSGACALAMKIGGTLTRTGGGTMSYTIATASTGSPTISFTTTLNSTFSFTPTNGTTSISLNVYLIVPNGIYASGLYSDSTALAQIYDGATLKGSGAVTPSVNYTANTCNIGGSANGGTQSVDFSNGATIQTSAKSAAFGAVDCNSPATITLRSANGAATATGASGANHQNFFDYIASTTVNGATVILDTSSNPAIGTAESASASIVANTTTNAALSVGITPKSPGKPLAAGTYSDVLTVTITAN